MAVPALVPLLGIHFRLARFYLERLRLAEAAYRRGHENALLGCKLFDNDWAQIQHWQAWTKNHADEDGAIAQLCLEFPLAGQEILLFRQPSIECLDWLETGLQAALSLGDVHTRMVFYYLIGRIQMHIGARAEALEAAETALNLAQQLGDSLYICRDLYTLGTLHYMHDQYERAQTAFEQCLTLSQQLGALREAGHAYNGLGNVAYTENRYEQALECYEQALEISERIGRATATVVLLNNISDVLMQLGDTQTAAAYAERCVSLCQITGDERGLAETLATLGKLAEIRGDLLAAKRYFQQSLHASRNSSHLWNQAFVLIRLGYTRYQLGEISAALEDLANSYAIATGIEDWWYCALAVMYTVEVYRGSGDLSRAHAKLREGLEIISRFDNNAMRTKYLLQSALLWRDEGKVEQAAQWIGLLETRTRELTPDQRRRLSDLRLSLEAHVPQETLAAWIERGNLIQLADAINDIAVLTS